MNTQEQEKKPETLWDNEMVRHAMKTMSPEDIEKYRKIGESMYKDIDFETAKISNKDQSCPQFLADSVAYLTEAIKSGLHPSMLTEDEKNILEEFYGKEWYKQWDYTKEDLDEFYTIKKD
jgi:hypothetical protein